MWNGFEGEYGHKAFPLFIIFMINTTTLAFSRLETLSFYLFSSYLSIRFFLPSLLELFIYITIILFFWALYVIVPGKIEIGSINNSGRRYNYKLNSLPCMLISIVSQFLLAFFDILPLESFSKHFSSVAITVFFIGNLIAILAYLKGRFYPTFSTTESQGRNLIIEDFYSGIELVPRFSQSSPLDLKLFSIGHVGMVSWQLLNISHAAYGLNRGSVDALVVCLLQSIYIFDWAFYERWYLYTVDIQHDRLGFYLGYGSFGWMQVIYTSYGYYASHIPANHSYIGFAMVIVLYLLGYWMMRTSNNQKETFRKNSEKEIWGKKPEYMVANYTTQDGKVRQNKLLLSGFWGWARHFNYVGDLLLCLSISILCGFHSAGAHIYSFQLTGILTTRAVRDDTRCSLKYGEDWKKYQEKNKYLLIPGLW